jgi:predicted permease
VTFPETAHFTLEGRPPEDPEKRPYVGHFLVSPNYFSTLQAPLLEGRDFTLSDNADSQPVAIVSRAFAEKYLPHQNPLGQHVKVGDLDSTKWAEIVGVMGDIKEFLGQGEEKPQIFEPFLAHPAGATNLVARTRSDPAAFGASMRAAVWAVDKDQAVNTLRTMDQVVKDSRQGDDLMTEMMSTFAGLALLMAAVGIYGLLAYLVEQRTHEFGIRMALGARGREVLRLVFRNSMTLVLLGVGIGFLVSLALPSLFAASFNGFHVHSFWVLALTPCAVTLVALAACYLPARRAAKVDPIVALRYE